MLHQLQRPFQTWQEINVAKKKEKKRGRAKASVSSCSTGFFRNCDRNYYNVTIALVWSASSDYLCQEKVCLALTHTVITVRQWSECLFLLDTPTLPHLFSELTVKLSKCVFLLHKINCLCAAAGSKTQNNTAFWWQLKIQGLYQSLCLLPFMKYKSHNYYYCQLLSKNVWRALPAPQTCSGVTSS